MEKSKIKYFVDIGMLIAIALCGLTGIIKFPLLRYSGPFRYEMTLIHDWSGIAFVVLAVVHIVLNFSWMVVMTKNILKLKK